MCRLSSSDHHLYRRTSVKPERSLLEWLRALWRSPQPQRAEVRVVAFPAEAGARIDREADQRSAKAA